MPAFAHRRRNDCVLPHGMRAKTFLDDLRVALAASAIATPRGRIFGDRGPIVLELWKAWIEAMRFVAEAQAVVCLRLMMLASGNRKSSQEAVRMVSEKFITFSDAEIAAAKALARGRGPMVAAERAYSPLRRRVHANSRRLLHTRF